ncbi:MAG: glutamate ligase domain-containing protein, partial [Candidatus Krumholzibacteriia bacterium]
HCYEVFAGDAYAKLVAAEPGTFFLTDFLARRFERLVFQGLGLDRFPRLRKTYFGRYRKMVYLAQTKSPALEEKARSAADSVGLELERPFESISRALEEFLGVARRFEIRAVEHDVVFVDDYGHHPTEIAATLRAAKCSYGRRVVTVFQPHRYTRTRFLLKEFGRAFFDADVLFLTDIYAASEDPIPGIDATLLERTIREHGHEQVSYFGDKEELTDAVASTIQKGDLVLTLGAGDVSALNDLLVDKWRQRVEAGMS